MNSQMNQKPTASHGGPNNNQRSHANFIEALKSIGNQTVNSVKNDVVGGVGRGFIEDLTNSRANQTRSNQTETGLTPEQQIHLEVQRIARQRELNETKVFDSKAEETKTRIKVIQEELKMLAKELAGLDIALEKAIEEEIVNPGTYHVTFFEKLRRILIDLRRRVADSANWLEVSSQRQAAQKGYWGNVKKSGTKYLLSQERTLATQAG
jgi:hypothetical protein